MSVSMTTPINLIPLKTNMGDKNEKDDSDDPLVQDVLKEFEKEISINKQAPNINLQQQQQQMMLQQQQQQMMLQQQQQQLPIKQQTASCCILNNEFIKKSVIIIIIIYIIINSGVIISLYTILPTSINNYLFTYDTYIKLILIFVSIYSLYFYDVL